ncbi:MAG: glycerophosphodiester phosphodiesterase family protein, partial [Pseudoclavibacter sp.]
MNHEAQPADRQEPRTAFPGEHPALIGHRGAPAYLPEHTAASYRLAIAQGADFVEPDLVPTRDGVLAIRHEPLLDHTTDVSAFAEFARRRRSVDVGEFRAEGLFTLDFDWAELQELRAVEPLPDLREASAAHDGEWSILRLRDLVELVADTRETAPDAAGALTAPDARGASGASGPSNAPGIGIGGGARACGLVIELKHT